jgi:hypothetical protein
MPRLVEVAALAVQNILYLVSWCEAGLLSGPTKNAGPTLDASRLYFYNSAALLLVHHFADPIQLQLK